VVRPGCGGGIRSRAWTVVHRGAMGVEVGLIKVGGARSPSDEDKGKHFPAGKPHL
jgi:hypothetical protein